MLEMDKMSMNSRQNKYKLGSGLIHWYDSTRFRVLAEEVRKGPKRVRNWLTEIQIKRWPMLREVEMQEIN